MVVSTAVVVAALWGAEARPAGAGDGSTEAARRRGFDQCRIVEPGARLAEGRGVQPERAALERSRARSRAARSREAESTGDERGVSGPGREGSGETREGGPSQRARGDEEPGTSGDEGEGSREATRGGRYYSAARTLDLELGVVVRREVAPDARVELRLLTPRGHPYQRLRVARAAEARSPRTATSRERTAPRATPRALTATLPLAGTAIVNHSLYGEWTVEPWLDGEPCGPSVRFWIGE